MAANIRGGQVGIILLGQVDGERLTWYAGRKGLFVTRHGRVVQTAGLPANLLRSDYLDKDPIESVINLKEIKKESTFRRLVDMAPPDNYGVMILSTFHRDAVERIEIAELAFDTVVYTERCRSRGMDWTFENRYWIGTQDGVIWQSHQYVHPSLPPVELQLLKPYTG